MEVICEREDCLHNWPGNKCALKHIVVGKDLTCQDYHRPKQVKHKEDKPEYWESDKIDQSIFQPIPMKAVTWPY